MKKKSLDYLLNKRGPKTDPFGTSKKVSFCERNSELVFVPYFVCDTLHRS